MNFTEINIADLSFNPFDKIGKEWYLITSGDLENYNTMTASWGGLGVMWGKNIFTACIRTNRRTFEFAEDNELFTFSFFNDEFKQVLSFCGTHSGYDCDKASDTGLIPVEMDGVVTFKQAELVFVCRKIYSAMLSEDSFIDKSFVKFYEKDPYHKAYVCEILKVYQKI